MRRRKFHFPSVKNHAWFCDVLIQVRHKHYSFNGEGIMRTTVELTLIGIFLAGVAGGSLDAQSGVAKPMVRALKFNPANPEVLFRLGGQSKVIRLGDAAAVEKLLGKASAKGLIDLVDFKTEAIVFVSWTTSGPPDGTLNHEIKKDGTVQFYVQGPPGAQARGERARLGGDFFAVPANRKASFDPKER
jgi:hypothetical protein